MPEEGIDRFGMNRRSPGDTINNANCLSME